MDKFYAIFFNAMYIILVCMAHNIGAQDEKFMHTVEPVTEVMIKTRMRHSWRDNCPVPFHDLVLILVSHWGYDEQIHHGEMVVHRRWADEIIDIFRELFECRFPIERMRLIDEYAADDDLSMADNNSSAFCCRAITNKPGIFSHHSYGIAIDINPLANPYVKKGQVLPEQGRDYLDRSPEHKGIITADKKNPCYRAFTKRGWHWGGDWQQERGYVDYQHFSKVHYSQNFEDIIEK